jgi:hypothetical protein
LGRVRVRLTEAEIAELIAAGPPVAHELWLKPISIYAQRTNPTLVR